MITVSNAFLERMQYNTRFRLHATITLENGNELELEEQDFALGKNNLSDGAGNGTFPIGAAIERSVTLELMNDDDRYEDVSFLGATVQVSITFELDDTGLNVEGVNFGTFTVTEPESYGQTVILTALDDMYRADQKFSTSLTFPTTALALLNNICTSTGIVLGSTSFTNSGFEIEKAPTEEMTFRQVIGYIAMIAGGNARIDRSGELRIISYDFNYTGSFELTAFHQLKTGLDDIVITGVKTENSSGTEIQTGTDGYVISMKNPLWEGREQTAMTLIGSVLIGGTFRDFDGDHISCPILEFMDKVTLVDRKGNTINTILTDVDFKFSGYTTLKNSAESAARNSSRYNSAAAQALAKARQLVTVERTQREAAIQNLANQLANSSGMYLTTEQATGGGTIYYLHDKPDLEDSETVIKLNADALGISTDGGQTYPFGFDFSGNAILNKIYAIGIDADYVNIGNKTVTETLHDDYYTQTETNTQITAGINGFSSVVAQTYTTKAAFDGLEIGGTNLIRNTGDYRDAARLNTETELLDSGEEGVKILSFFPYTGDLAWRAVLYRPYIPYSIVRGTKVTLSYWYRSDSWQSVSGGHDYPVASFNLYDSQSTTTRKRYIGIYGNIPTPTTTWQKYVGSFVITDALFTGGSGTITGSEFFSVAMFQHNKSNLQIKKLKLEVGDKATAWSPSPEDNTAEKMVSMINQTASSVQIQAEHISLTGKTINLTSDNIVISSDNFSVTSAGVITATSGKIGGWDIGASSLYHTMTSLTDTTTNGVYIGLDGIGFGKATSWIKADGSFRFGAIQSVASTGTNDDAWVTNALHISYGIELYAGNDNSEPYIDFRRDRTGPSLNDTYDYTARISNSSDNCVSFYGKKTKTATTADPCTVTAYAFSQGSDRRLKNRISLLNTDKARAFIKALKPSSFYYNGVEEVHHGFIYDDVESEKYNRDWVVSKMAQNLFGDGVPYGTVSILEIVPDMVAVMQELIADNESLKAQIAALRSA